MVELVLGFLVVLSFIFGVLWRRAMGDGGFNVTFGRAAINGIGFVAFSIISYIILMLIPPLTPLFGSFLFLPVIAIGISGAVLLTHVSWELDWLNVKFSLMRWGILAIPGTLLLASYSMFIGAAIFMATSLIAGLSWFFIQKIPQNHFPRNLTIKIGSWKVTQKGWYSSWGEMISGGLTYGVMALALILG